MYPCASPPVFPSEKATGYSVGNHPVHGCPFEYSIVVFILQYLNTILIDIFYFLLTYNTIAKADSICMESTQ